MQLSEAFRRGVVVGLSDQSDRELNGFFINKPSFVGYLPLNERTFISLFKDGIFARLNDCCGLFLEDCAEEFLPAVEVPTALLEITRSRKENRKREVEMGLLGLTEVLEYAQLNSRGVYFIL